MNTAAAEAIAAVENDDDDELPELDSFDQEGGESVVFSYDDTVSASSASRAAAAPRKKKLTHAAAIGADTTAPSPARAKKMSNAKTKIDTGRRAHYEGVGARDGTRATRKRSKGDFDQELSGAGRVGERVREHEVEREVEMEK